MFLKKFPVSELIHGDLAIVLDGYLAEPLLPPERFLPHRHDDIGWQGVVQSKGEYITSTVFTPVGQMSVIEAEVWIRHGTYRIKSDKVRRQHYLLGDEPTHSKDKAWIEAKSTVGWEWSAEKHVDDSPNFVADLPDWIGGVGGHEGAATSKKVGKVVEGDLAWSHLHRAIHSQPTNGGVGGYEMSTRSKKVGKVVEGDLAWLHLHCANHSQPTDDWQTTIQVTKGQASDTLLAELSFAKATEIASSQGQPGSLISAYAHELFYNSAQPDTAALFGAAGGWGGVVCKICGSQSCGHHLR
jgi:hypothetical protein